MEFEPVYLADRLNHTEDGKGFAKNKLNVINPRGTVGVVTLWTDPERVWNQWFGELPGLFVRDSPLVAITSLYGNGFPQFLANLANNPQINKIVVTGKDIGEVVPSSKYLPSFLNRDFEEIEFGGIRMNKINGTSFYLDAQFSPEMFSHLRTERFRQSDLERIVSFISEETSQRKDRVKIELKQPAFSDYPSDITNHNIVAATPLDGWMEVMYRIDRFGKNINIGAKGVRRALFNLDVNIIDSEVDVQRAVEFGFCTDVAESYMAQILSGELPGDSDYSYGNRVRAYWGGDALDVVAKRLKANKDDRYSFISLWDTKRDLIDGKSHPCLTDVYFANNDGRLMLSAGFRTHNAVSAYLYNLYALRALQEYVTEGSGIEQGQINIRSRFISIDPSDTSLDSKMNLIKERRRVPLQVNDPRGYFVANGSNGKITLDHYSPEGILIHKYEGDSASAIKNQLRRDVAVLEPDHAIWIGYNLARAEQELHGEIKEL